MINRTYYTPGAVVPADIDSKSPEQIGVFCCFNKGPTPVPFSIVQNETTGDVLVTFEISAFTQTCDCQIQCTTGALAFDDEEEVGSFCPQDTDFKAALSGKTFSDSEPTDLIFWFTDSKGNTVSIQVTSIASVRPIAPLLALVDDPLRDRIEIGVLPLSRTHVDLSDAVTEYQIERYVGHPAAKKLLVDWVRIPTGTHAQRNNRDLVEWDVDVRSGVEHGYRIRFRSTFDQTSRWSDWRTVTP